MSFTIVWHSRPPLSSLENVGCNQRLNLSWHTVRGFRDIFRTFHIWKALTIEAFMGSYKSNLYSIEPHIGWDDQSLRTVQHVHE